MLTKSVRYFTLALTLVVLTASARIANAQPGDKCTDPSTGCVVGGGDPQPTVVGGGDPQPTVAGDTAAVSTDDDNSDDGLDDLVTFLIGYYGLA